MASTGSVDAAGGLAALTASPDLSRSRGDVRPGLDPAYVGGAAPGVVVNGRFPHDAHDIGGAVRLRAPF